MLNRNISFLTWLIIIVILLPNNLTSLDVIKFLYVMNSESKRNNFFLKLFLTLHVCFCVVKQGCFHSKTTKYINVSQNNRIYLLFVNIAKSI